GDCTEKGDAGDDCTFQDEDDPMPDDEDAGCKAGLRCNPSSLTCVANCSEEYPCTVNAECPDGLACVPVTVDDDANSWMFCEDLGTSAETRCDEDADCVEGRYCNGTVCVADEEVDDACTRNEMCEAGSFCDLATVSGTGASITAASICTTYFEPEDACYPLAATLGYSSGCSLTGASECLVNYQFDGDGLFTGYDFQCDTTKRPAGGECFPAAAFGHTGNEPNECQDGLICEATDDVANTYHCTVPADLGDECDDIFN